MWKEGIIGSVLVIKYVSVLVDPMHKRKEDVPLPLLGLQHRVCEPRIYQKSCVGLCRLNLKGEARSSILDR